MKLDIARNLLNLGAVKFSILNPYSYASGLKGPIYCDNRLILSHTEFRDKIITTFIDTIKKYSLNFDHLCGIATAGIPYAAIVADRMKKPMLYVRPKRKEHGRLNQVEGDYKSGQKVLLFEDLVNQGSSLLDSMQGLKLAQLNADSCLCVVDYEMQGTKRILSDLSMQLYSLTDFTSLTSVAFELNLINIEGLEDLRKWQADPKAWSAKF